MTTPPKIDLVHHGRAAKAARGELAAFAEKAINTLKANARPVPALATAVAIVSTAVANTPGMNDAKANWNALAKALEVTYPSLIGNAVFLSRADWQADDREEFLNATALFCGELQKLSGVCYTMEGKVDAIHQAYYDYWKGIVFLSAAVTLYITAVHRVARLNPASAAAAQLALQRLGPIVNSLTAKMTALLGGYLGLIGSTLVPLTQRMLDLNNVMPTGAMKIDFKKAAISTEPPSSWVAPKREVGEPAANKPDPKVDAAIDKITGREPRPQY
ncbi:hypothetical protein ACFQ08_23195 [Streptosporangium algeriense]|uniref:PPE family protein n=1 Tax=Streptosporangium algeriense TaxID=1682748 RepID=A0ABW3DWJ4_9ACTN